ncbi:PAS and ANTAR domain-containing protein [Mycobacteroides abscessus]|uniref:PAS and ANTAR domain-containing protein n=1 Tax=Mycobacteroides abscessus TaxID=36809 RepID=UPI00232E812E|nr:PAS and ANTAR domain-containing protein [Mycobacteroides abscessus]MDB2197181.1 PAS and ANTAR domain-containing protein [Mycobacteroides abscessus subsp. abscessus]MDB2201959.1 PAS and ANTAR domain-containing protein [Mycobacteroides abscessus subsp. abscessus]MDO3110869.1 PAS and ANTAR domain-containing protein [Mycobacteroides abscessus subsp. abscessus]
MPDAADRTVFGRLPLQGTPEDTQGGHHLVGRFQFFVAGQRWVWSDEAARMHGYEPGEVNPTSELLLSHKHPDDRAKVAEILHRVQTGGLFSSRHRIIDNQGCTRWMVVVSDRMTDTNGHVIGTQGYYIDVTAGLQSDLTDAVVTVTESRAVIEQAKGVLMATYGIDADRAFDILKWRSQTAQTKLKTVAAHFMEAVMKTELSPDTVTVIDHLLLAAGGSQTFPNP